MLGFLIVPFGCGGIIEGDDAAGGSGGATPAGVGGQVNPQDSCDSLCQDASECPGTVDFDFASCRSGCRDTLEDVESQGCVAQYNVFLVCWDICNPGSLSEQCASQYLAFTQCMNGV